MSMPRTKQKGAMLITVSLWFVALIGLTALAFDIGHLMVVRNELQNAADAAALAGANCLNKTTAGSGTDCTNLTSSTLNWTIASTKATNSIGLNKSDNTALVNGEVLTGYWNVNGGTTMQPTTLSPLGPCTKVGGVMTTACDKPAVMVTLRRDAGNNGGSVGTLVATMFGGTAIPIRASAVAVISSPGTCMSGCLVPVAINKCMFDLYWDSATNTPKTATSTSLLGVPQTIGQPWEIRIGSAYHYPSCDSGQWTSFQQNVNDVPAIQDLIDNGNPDPIGIGDNTWIQPGTKNVLFGDLFDKYPAGSEVTVVVVDMPSGLNDHGAVPIVGFAGFQITDIKGGSDKYIQGHFIPALPASGSSGVGPSYGAYTPPRLAQ